MPFAILACFNGVCERSLNFLRRLRVLHGHPGDVNSGLVAILNFLQQFLHRIHDFFLAGREQEIHLVFPHHLANCRLCRLHHRLVGIPVIEQVVLRILDYVLHGELDVDDVLVVRDHQGLILHFVLDVVVAVTDFDGSNPSHIDDLDGLNRPRQVPARTRIRSRTELSETQHDSLLAGLDNVETAEQPTKEDQNKQQTQPATHLASCRARWPTTTVTLGSKQGT